MIGGEKQKRRFFRIEIMRATFILYVFVSIVVTTLAWRSQTTGSSSAITIGERGGAKRISGDKERHKSEQTKAPVQHFNIGLIVPHTNFGKREYARAINTAILALQKMRDTKLPFLHEYEFTAKNVHFDMILLTPSPTSKYFVYM